MKKDLNKRMMASVLSLLLVAATATSFVVKDRVQADNAAAAAQAPITELKILKKLKLPKGVQTPNKEFSFKFTKVSFGGKTTEEEKNKMPNIGDAKVNFSQSDTLSADKETVNKDATVSLSDITWQNAGQYTYNVEENNITDDKTDSNYEGIYSKSNAKYVISFFVVDQNNKKVVSAIYLKREVADNNDNSASQQSAKVPYNPTPSGTEENGFRFTNIYNKKVKPIPDGGSTDDTVLKRGLKLNKKINGSDLFKNQDFRFKVTVTPPATVTNDVNDIQYNHSTGASSKNNNYKSGIEFNLKGDEYAALSNIWLGSTVTVEEVDYKGAASATITGNAGSTAITADTSNQFKTMTFTLTENGNWVQFENKEQTPTGVLIDNLPFIILALLAVAGLYYFKRSHSQRA